MAATKIKRKSDEKLPKSSGRGWRGAKK